jgi:hypothetical protein
LIAFDNTTPWGKDNQTIVLLGLDMIYRAAGGTKTPEEVGRHVGYGGTVEVFTIPGNFIGGNYDWWGNRRLGLFVGDRDSAYVSPEGVKTVVHEFAHGVDRAVAIDRGLYEYVFSISTEWAYPLGYTRCEQIDSFVAEGAWDFVGDPTIAPNNYGVDARQPYEDFADSFASVVFEENLKLSRSKKPPEVR